MVAVYGRKGLVDPLRRTLGRDAEALPTLKLVPAPAQLGKGSLDVEIHVDVPDRGKHDAGAKKKKNPGVSVHVLLMGEAKSTWIAIGTNRPPHHIRPIRYAPLLR